MAGLIKLRKNENGKLPIGFLLTIFVGLILAHSMVTGLATLSGQAEALEHSTKAPDPIEKAIEYVKSFFTNEEETPQYNPNYDYQYDYPFNR